MSIKVAIADDHQLITEGLQNMLRYNDEIEVIATYANGAQLLKGISTIEPDILLLDIVMPGQRGDELAKIIMHDFPSVKIIALTNLDNIYYIKSMVQLGVSGYLLKDIRRESLSDAILKVYKGEEYWDSVVREKLQMEHREIKKQAAYGSLLTRREKEVLQLIAENTTSKEIADKLHLSKRTIDRHRASMLSKMDVKNVSALLKKAIELGIISV